MMAPDHCQVRVAQGGSAAQRSGRAEPSHLCPCPPNPMLACLAFSDCALCFPKDEGGRLDAAVPLGQGRSKAGSLPLPANANSGSDTLSDRECPSAHQWAEQSYAVPGREGDEGEPPAPSPWLSGEQGAVLLSPSGQVTLCRHPPLSLSPSAMAAPAPPKGHIIRFCTDLPWFLSSNLRTRTIGAPLRHSEYLQKGKSVGRGGRLLATLSLGTWKFF